MNKYQKVASQHAKDEMKKFGDKSNSNYRFIRNHAIKYFNRSNININVARAYKNYFKTSIF